MPSLPSRWLAVAASCTVSMFGAGCGGDKVPRLYPATGKVVVHGEPAGDVLVVFVPAKKEQESLITRSTAVTAPDGTFTLVAKKPGDGVPAGEYIVTLTLLGPTRFALRPKAVRPPPQIDKKYRDTEQSPLRVTIEPVPAGETYRVPTIEVP